MSNKVTIAMLRVVKEITKLKRSRTSVKLRICHLDKDRYYHSHDSSSQLSCMYDSAIVAFTIHRLSDFYTSVKVCVLNTTTVR